MKYSAITIGIVLLTAGYGWPQGFDVQDRDLKAKPWVPGDLRVEVIAREPLVQNVTALAFDQRGRLFISEGRQYRSPGRDSPSDTVELLIDSDQDGLADKKTTFAEGFHSIQDMVWRGGDLWVANAPNLTVARDTDGDDRADEYVLVFTGLGTLEHGIHGLNWAPDGMLYISKGDTPVQSYAPRAFRDLAHVVAAPGVADHASPQVYTHKQWQSEWRKHYVVPTDGHTEGGVLRYEPASGKLEIFCRGMRNPWDIGFDDEFNWLATDNDDIGGDRIIMPFYGAHFGHHHPWSNSWTGKGHLPTVSISGPLFEGSGTGVVFFRGDHFPDRYQNSFLINDWLLGKTYVFRPSWHGALMTASSDSLDVIAETGVSRALYRPTQIKIGPDGSIYVGGWGSTYGYSKESEGRVYRISSKSQQAASELNVNRLLSPMAEQSVEYLIRDLDSDVEVRRVDAQDELISRGPKITEDLRTAFLSGNLTTRQETWLLWTIGRTDLGNNRVDNWFAELASKDEDGRSTNTRIQAIRILTFRVSHAGDVSGIVNALAKCLSDPNLRVRFEAIQSIWQSDHAVLAPHLKGIVRRVGTPTRDNRLVHYAAWNALSNLLDESERKEMLNADDSPLIMAAMLGLLRDRLLDGDTVLRLSQDASPEIAELARSWLAKVGYGLTDSSQIVKQLKALDDRHIDYQLRMDLLAAMQHAPLSEESWSVLNTMYWARYENATLRTGEVVWQQKGEEIAAALRVMSDDRRTVEMYWHALNHAWPNLREAAVADYYRTGDAGKQFILDHLPGVDVSWRARAIQALAKFGYRGDPWRPTQEVIRAMNVTYDTIDDIKVRQAILQLLAVVDAEHAQSAGTIGTIRAIAEKAANDPNPRIHTYVTSIAENLKESIAITAPQREPVTAEHILPLLRQADKEKGRKLFFDATVTGCANCHVVHGAGRGIGPDLSGIGARSSVQQIMESILQPNAVIIEGFRMTDIGTDDGRDLSGVVHGENDHRLSLIQTDGQSIEVDKATIIERRERAVSLMPSGFETLLTDREIADMVSWLITLKEDPDIAKEGASGFSFEQLEGRVKVNLDGKAITTYVYDDADILRPYFENIKTTSGIQVTRPNPPGRDKDADHASMHPGLWLGFGIVSGQDFWRNKASIVHDRFVVEPKGGDVGTFLVRNRFESVDGDLICRQDCKYEFRRVENGYMLVVDTHYWADEPFWFGVQEEMGLGLRTAEDLRVDRGGTILNSKGGLNEGGTWGRVAEWWDYYAKVGDRQVGVMIMSGPENPPAWSHSRDYGCIVINPFPVDRKENRGKKIEVVPGVKYRLLFGVYVHDSTGEGESDRKDVYKHFLQVVD